MGTRLDRRELLRVGGTTLALMGSGSLATFARAFSARSTSDRDPVLVVLWVYADSCGLKTAFLGNGGRNAATIFSLRYSSSG